MSENMHHGRRVQMGELRYALVASIITLIGAIGIYSTIPYIHDTLLSGKEAPLHSRNFELSARGGSITYSVEEGVKDENYRKRLETDLQLLEKRFRAGKFEMATLPGSRSAAPVTALLKVQNRVEYSMNKGDKSVTLVLAGRDALTVKAIQEYLSFLKTNWMQRH